MRPLDRQGPVPPRQAKRHSEKVMGEMTTLPEEARPNNNILLPSESFLRALQILLLFLVLGLFLLLVLRRFFFSASTILNTRPWNRIIRNRRPRPIGSEEVGPAGYPEAPCSSCTATTSSSSSSRRRCWRPWGFVCRRCSQQLGLSYLMNSITTLFGTSVGDDDDDGLHGNSKNLGGDDGLLMMPLSSGPARSYHHVRDNSTGSFTWGAGLGWFWPTLAWRSRPSHRGRGDSVLLRSLDTGLRPDPQQWQSWSTAELLAWTRNRSRLFPPTRPYQADPYGPPNQPRNHTFTSLYENDDDNNVILESVIVMERIQGRHLNRLTVADLHRGMGVPYGMAVDWLDGVRTELLMTTMPTPSQTVDSYHDHGIRAPPALQPPHRDNTGLPMDSLTGPDRLFNSSRPGPSLDPWPAHHHQHHQQQQSPNEVRLPSYPEEIYGWDILTSLEQPTGNADQSTTTTMKHQPHVRAFSHDESITSSIPLDSHEKSLLDRFGLMSRGSMTEAKANDTFQHEELSNREGMSWMATKNAASSTHPDEPVSLSPMMPLLDSMPPQIADIVRRQPEWARQLWLERSQRTKSAEPPSEPAKGMDATNAAWHGSRSLLGAETLNTSAARSGEDSDRRLQAGSTPERDDLELESLLHDASSSLPSQKALDLAHSRRTTESSGHHQPLRQRPPTIGGVPNLLNDGDEYTELLSHEEDGVSTRYRSIQKGA